MMLDEEQTEPNQEAAIPDPGAETTPAPAAKEPPAPTVEAQPVADLAAELARERAQVTEYMQRWQRAQADLANYKRRAEQEREQTQKYGAFPLCMELLKI